MNKKIVSPNSISANTTKHWAAGRICAANEDLLTQNLKNKIEAQQRQSMKMFGPG